MKKTTKKRSSSPVKAKRSSWKAVEQEMFVWSVVALGVVSVVIWLLSVYVSNHT